MGLTNCSQCGTLFQTYGGGRRCPACLDAEHDDFRKVVEYLRESNDRTIDGIAAATGVERHLILRWLRQQRLQVELVPGELTCRRCGAVVPGGSFCDACRMALANEVAEQRRLAGHVSPIRVRSSEPAAPAGPDDKDARAKRERRGMHYRSFTESSPD